LRTEIESSKKKGASLAGAYTRATTAASSKATHAVVGRWGACIAAPTLRERCGAAAFFERFGIKSKSNHAVPRWYASARSSYAANPRLHTLFVSVLRTPVGAPTRYCEIGV
jgi:hypothetical protein